MRKQEGNLIRVQKILTRWSLSFFFFFFYFLNILSYRLCIRSTHDDFIIRSSPISRLKDSSNFKTSLTLDDTSIVWEMICTASSLYNFFTQRYNTKDFQFVRRTLFQVDTPMEKFLVKRILTSQYLTKEKTRRQRQSLQPTFDTFPRLKLNRFVRSTINFFPAFVFSALRNHLPFSLPPPITFDFNRNVFVNMPQYDDYVKGCDVREEM